MNCNELREFYELYAIGVAEDPERAEIRAHLNRECEACMLGIKKAREVAALLEGTAAPAEPSPKLRRRILAAVGVEERRFGWAPFLAAALALSLFAVVYFIGQQGATQRELARAIEVQRGQNIELTRLNEAFVIPKGGKPQRAGMFQSASDGTAMHIQHGIAAPNESLVAVTLEPFDGSDQPTTTPLFAAPIHGLVP